MTEKRFTYLDASKNKYIGSFFCNDVPLTNNEVVELLNTLTNENDVLKQQLKTKYIVNKQYEEKIRLEKENEDLKHKLLQISAKICFYKDIPIEFEQWFFTEIVELLEDYDKETLIQITNALLGE